MEGASLGHWDVSLDNRVTMHKQYIFVNSYVSAFMAQKDRTAEIREHILKFAKCHGIRMVSWCLVIKQMKIPAVVDFIFLFGMNISCINLLCNPTLKEYFNYKGLMTIIPHLCA